MSALDKRLGRGVFTMPFRDVYGRRIAVAIDHSGRCIDWTAFEPEERFHTFARLWSRLEHHDQAAAMS